MFFNSIIQESTVRCFIWEQIGENIILQKNEIGWVNMFLGSSTLLLHSILKCQSLLTKIWRCMWNYLHFILGKTKAQSKVKWHSKEHSGLKLMSSSAGFHFSQLTWEKSVWADLTRALTFWTIFLFLTFTNWHGADSDLVSQ